MDAGSASGLSHTASVAIERARIGFVVGLTAEAALLRGSGFAVGVGGGWPQGAAAAAAKLLDDGALALVSFGLAGGLAPGLAAGALLVPRAVLAADQRLVCDTAMLIFLGGANADALCAGSTIAVTVAEKAALHAQTGAAAVDLESGAVGQVAAARGAPFAVLRAVADPAGRNLPPAALLALDAGGKIKLGAVLASVARQPGQIAGLIGLALDAGRARRALQRRVGRLPARVVVAG